MDGAVKQRLVGAAVLVVLAVIFLPMVFDGADDRRSESIDLDIPAEPEREFETRVVPLEAPAPIAPIVDPGAIATVDANAPERVDALAGTPDAPAATPASAARAPAAPPAPAPATAPTPTPAPTTTAPAPVAREPAPRADARGRYLVTFGSYGKAENADALVAALKKAGIDARSERVDLDGKPGMRVRSGPFVDRAQAEKVRLLARRARPDAPATVVELDETPTADVPAPAVAARGSGWAVQVGAYQAEADATSQRDKLRGAGFSAYIDTVRTAQGTMHRVRVGPELRRANAETLRGALRSKLGLDGLVVPHP